MQTKCLILCFSGQGVHLLWYYLSVCDLFADNCHHTLNFVQCFFFILFYFILSYFSVVILGLDLEKKIKLNTFAT